MAKINKFKKRKLSKEPIKDNGDKTIANTPATTTDPTDSDSDSSLSESDTDKVQKLLEPYSKDQLIEFIVDAAIKDSSLYNRIRDMADSDVSHRKIFVHGLGWDTTRENLTKAFESYGEIEDCNVVTDRNTGKAKGFGFVLFKTRKGTEKALKDPRKKISNRVASCQLASLGPAPLPQSQDASARKIYVSNVQPDVDAEKLRSFFAKFGEIETGPIGFDMHTGKSRGFALFLYKTEEGARKVLVEPYKMFEGHQLHCQKAADSKKKAPAMAAPQAQTQVQAPVLAAVAAAQNMMYNQQPALNPMYSGFIGNPSAGFFGGPVNPMMAAGPYNQSLISPSQLAMHSMGNTAMGLSGFGMPPPSVLGAYGSNAPGMSMQHAYPNAQTGQASSARGNAPGGSFSGYRHMWRSPNNSTKFVALASK